MAIPSSLYNTDTIATYGTTEIELTKKIEDLYPTTGNVDNSIAYTKYNASWLYTAGVTCYPYEDGGSSIKFADYEPDTSYCYKYYNWESDVPLTDSNVNVCIIAPGSTAGYYYINSESIIDYGINDSRFVRNAQTNKMLFTAQARRINLTELEPYELERGSASHVFPLQTVDLKYIDSHPDEYFYDFSLTGCLVWNGSDWITASYVPAYISTSSSSQGIATINTCFNRRGIYYDMDVRQDSELYIHEDGSSDGFEANGVTGWSLGWPQNVEVAPYYISIGDMANLNALIEAEIEGEETRIDIITCQRAIPVNDIWYYFTWCSGVYYNHPDGVRNASHSSYYCPCIKGSTLSKLIAGCGLYFLADPDADLTSITPNTLGNCADIWLGEMNGDYITTGNWIKGANINTYTGANREGNVFNGGFDPNYKPSPAPGPYDDDPWKGASFSGVGVGGAGAFAKCYYMTSTELANLRSWMNSINVPEGFDPMQQIIGLSQVPVELSGSGPENVVFVNSSAVYDPGVTTRAVDTGVSTQQAMGTPISYYLGSVDIVRRMQQRGEPYLDYDCQIELYLTLIGMFSLDTQAVMGRTISAYAVLDPVSGTLAAYAYVSKGGQNLPVAYGSTTIGVDLPISAQQLSISRAALKQANAQLGASLLSGALTMLAAASSGGKSSGSGAKTATGSSGLSAAGIREAGSDYMKASQVGNVFGDFMQWGRTIRQLSYGNNTAIAGSFGGSTAQWSYPFTPYVKIIRPRYEKPSNYNHSQGVPCVQTKTIGSCTGFIQCIGADVSGITGATDLELQAIQAALSNGIYAGGGQ